MTANLKPCLFCKRDAMIIQEDELSEGFVYESYCTECQYRTPAYFNRDHLIEAHNAISDFEEKAVEVLAIRLGYLTDREFLTKEETIEYFEEAWRACTGENWQNFREQKRAEAKQLLGVKDGT